MPGKVRWTATPPLRGGLSPKYGGEVTSDAGERLLQAMAQLEAVADEVTAEDAARTFDEATLQMFWRDWPAIGSWSGALWRMLNRDLADAAHPSGALDAETGGSG